MSMFYLKNIQAPMLFLGMASYIKSNYNLASVKDCLERDDLCVLQLSTQPAAVVHEKILVH